MKRLDKKNINTSDYWDEHQTALDFGLRQFKCLELAGLGFAVAELGCGLSPLLAVLGVTGNFTECYGLDFSLKTIRKARQKYPDVMYDVGNVCETPWIDNAFDVTISSEVIEHLEEPEKLIAEMNRITKTGGKMIITTPILEFDDPEHLWEFTEEDMKKMMGTYGSVTCETIKSERFPGRSYIFAVCQK